MKRFFLLVFVTICDPLTRLGSPTSRIKPLTIVAVLLFVGGLGYYYYAEESNNSASVVQVIERKLETIETIIGITDRDALGRTPLHLAARYDNAQAVKMLLEQGADPNLQDNKGRTALHLTRFDQSDNIETIMFLLKAGADPNIKDNKGRTALQAARDDVNYTKHKQNLLKEYGGK